MRIKTELAERPPAYTVSHEGNKAIIAFYTDVQEKQNEDDETIYYEAVSWTMERPWNDNLSGRIAANTEKWLSLAQADAYETAAAVIREKRNNLLTESDAMMALDRMGLVVPSGTSFTSWLAFFKRLGEVLLGAIPIYRQALRDIPQQEGFPYNVVWPSKPAE